MVLHSTKVQCIVRPTKSSKTHQKPFKERVWDKLIVPLAKSGYKLSDTIPNKQTDVNMSN
jgi:hypothetical protein